MTQTNSKKLMNEISNKNLTTEQKANFLFYALGVLSKAIDTLSKDNVEMKVLFEELNKKEYI